MDSMFSTFFCFTSSGRSLKHRRGQHSDHHQRKRRCPTLQAFFPSPGDFFSPIFCGSPGLHLQDLKESFGNPWSCKREGIYRTKNNSIFQRSYVSWAYYFDLSYRILQTFIWLLIIFISVVSQGWNDIDSDRQAKKALEEYKKLYRSVSLKSPEQHFYNEIDIAFPLFCFQFPQWGFVHDQPTIERACESLHVLAKSWC